MRCKKQNKFSHSKKIAVGLNVNMALMKRDRLPEFNFKVFFGNSCKIYCANFAAEVCKNVLNVEVEKRREKFA